MTDAGYGSRIGAASNVANAFVGEFILTSTCPCNIIQLFHASAGNSAKYFLRGAGTGNSSHVGTCTEGKMFCTIAYLSLK